MAREIRISKRLQAIADLVSPDLVVADIGTDHALLPIFLILEGKTPAAIAMDVKEGPLTRARLGIAQAGLTDQITTRLSDGFAALSPGEARSAVIAGMGGDLMIRILTEGIRLARAMEELILAPQSHVAAVRAFVRAQGFAIDAEDMVYEDGKYYPMFRVRAGAEPDDASTEDRIAGWKQSGVYKNVSGQETVRAVPWDLLTLYDLYGELLLKQRHPVLRAYLLWERGVKEKILESLTKSGAQADIRREQVAADLAKNAEALIMMGANIP